MAIYRRKPVSGRLEIIDRLSLGEGGAFLGRMISTNGSTSARPINPSCLPLDPAITRPICCRRQSRSFSFEVELCSTDSSIPSTGRTRVERSIRTNP